MEPNRLSAFQLDVLREAGNIGAGHATTSMSKLMNNKVDMQVPSVHIMPFDEVLEWIGASDTPVAGIMIRIYGDAPGTVYFILHVEEAESLVKSMTQHSDIQLVHGETNHFAESAIKETGNILTGSYLSALSDFTGLHMQPSVPFLHIDMAGAIVSHALIEVSQVTDHALIIETEISYGGKSHRIHGNFLFLPDPGSFLKLFQSLGIEENE
ncbi:chemotaxis protein CheC [Lentibacillus sp.]|uniref:chemotaxis protein CheC n=1 Tax=Lentibacillus sp. TaxID=1925746 RepID=UPI002B4B7385|nr:chemotaxis protein CheC [Lentibacillus sp.]HLS07656.1 chemotaxis protein CheC [Lentibacillus sp.]